MKKILIEGWRGISHSYSLVNQYQIRELIKLGYDVYHKDVPFYRPQWDGKGADSGFPKKDLEKILGLTEINPDDADIIYRIAAPFRTEKYGSKPIYLFGTSEVQKLPAGVLTSREPSDLKNQNLHIITPSKWSSRGFIDAGLSEEQIRVVPHGVDYEIFRPLDPEMRKAARKHLKISEDEFVFLSVGAMTPNKGIDLLLAAFDRLAKKTRQIRLILKDQRVLYGITVEQVIQQVFEKQNIHLKEETLQKITIISQNLSLAEMATLYNIADCYVSPYRAEGFNLPPLEAASCGTPIVVTAGGATDEYIQPSFGDTVEAKLICTQSGNFLEPDLDNLVQILERSYTNTSRRLSPESVAAINQNLSWRNVGAHLKTLMDGAH